MIVGWLKALPKPLQIIIMILGAVVGAMFISSGLEQLLDLAEINPLIKLIIGLAILLITGRYALL